MKLSSLFLASFTSAFDFHCSSSIDCRDMHGLGHSMCNFDDGDGGFCESCDNQNSHQACIDSGFHTEAGTNECFKICIDGQYEDTSTSVAETDDTAISTLNNLEQNISEILSSESINKRSKWKQRWTSKILKNSARMRESFERCGTRDHKANGEIAKEYDTENPCRAINQLINGFSMWTERYIATCKGQKMKLHHQKRFERWNNNLNKGNRFRLKSIRIYETRNST